LERKVQVLNIVIKGEIWLGYQKQAESGWLKDEAAVNKLEVL
jgi:hypothetical protein